MEDHNNLVEIFRSQQSCSEDEEQQLEQDRPNKRGKYRDYDDAERVRVLQAWKDDKDWKQVADANEVNLFTAYEWIRQYKPLHDDDELSSSPPLPKKKPRGGSEKKLDSEQQDKVLEWFEENPELTLEQVCDKVYDSFLTTISTSTIWRYLEGRCISLKQMHKIPSEMNSMSKKMARKSYVDSLLSFEGENKKILYIDETNFNVFCRRDRGRAKVGERCKQVLPTTKGQNLHIIGCISVEGLLYWEHKRGAYRKDNAREWTMRMLDHATDVHGWDMSSLVVVLDNAPVHSRLEEISSMDEKYSGVSFLRLGPYSPQLNPIETLWSVVKNTVKREMAARLSEILNVPEGNTIKEHRLTILEGIAQEAMTQGSINTTCMRACSHVRKHYVPCIELRDLEVGT